MNQQPQQQNQQNINIKITDEILKGAYANMMLAQHTKEEFILDFMNIVPPNGIVTARVVTSPAHIKRIVNALTENLKQYETQFGKIEEGQAPTNQEIGFKV